MADSPLSERVLVVGRYNDGSLILKVEADAIERVLDLIDPEFDDRSHEEVLGVLMLDEDERAVIVTPDNCLASVTP